jgi:hypothetical protein
MAVPQAEAGSNLPTESNVLPIRCLWGGAGRWMRWMLQQMNETSG